jgi:TRAP-type C4-dicarboxylate transport system substrate-binding protein
MLTGLQTGLINAAYLPVMLAEASQFYRQANNMTDMKWAPLQGALVVHQKGWDGLTPELRDTVLEISREVGEELKNDIRRNEALSLEAMKKRGLEVWPVDEAAREEWRLTVEKAYARIRGNLVPADVFDEVVRMRDEFRAKNNP